MKKRYPFVRQERIQDCGVACLSMIISYYKGHVPISKLREMTHTTKEGTTAYHLIKAAEDIGLSARGVNCPLELIHDVSLPAIAHVIIHDTYQHYIVIYEVNAEKQQLLIADPSNKIEKISYDEFRLMYHSILILFHQKNLLPYIKNEFYIKKLLFPYIKTYWKNIIVVGISSFILMFCSILGTYYFQFLFVGFEQSQIIGCLVILLYFFGIFVKNIIHLFRSHLLLKMNIQFNQNLTCDTFFKILNLPYIDYRNQSTGDLISRIEDIYFIQNALNQFTVFIVVDLLIFLFSMICLAYLNLLLFFFVFTFCIIESFIFLYHYKYEENEIFIRNQKEIQVQSYLVEQLTGFEMCKGFSNQKEALNSFQKRYQECNQKGMQLQSWKNKKQFLKTIIYDICYGFLVWLSYLQIQKGNMSVGSFFTFQLLFLCLTDPLERMFEFFFTWKEAKRAWMRIVELPNENSSSLKEPKSYTIHCMNLTYFQNGMTPILKNINLTISPGKKMLILGSSGSGKSTLLKIIKGYYSSDQCKINHIPISKYRLDSIIYIPQNQFLFTGSVKENICLEQEIEEPVFEEICDLCEIKPIVQQSNLKYHMLLEENGFNISGGERQRIVLARALLQPFEVLLIDEGLSQMDHNLERRILKRMFSKFPTKTFIVVSHRLENMDLYDEVMELENGQIVKALRKEEFL